MRRAGGSRRAGGVALALLLAAPAPRAASPLDPVSPLETRVLGQNEWLAGSRVALRITVRDSEHDRPLLADLALALRPAAGGAEQVLWQGRTQEHGTADLSLKAPVLPPGPYRLTVAVRSPLGRDRVERDVLIGYDADAWLRPDALRYAPGDTLRLRAEVVTRPQLRPAARLPLPIEIQDPRGRRVFRRAIETSEWGIAWTSFALAREAPPGRWTIRAQLPRGEARTHIDVRARHEQALVVRLEPEKSWVTPGEQVRALARVLDRQGAPVGGVRTRLEAWTDGRIGAREATTDRAGIARFELPVHVALAAKAAAALERLALSVEAEDPRGRSGSARLEVPLSSQPLRLDLALEGQGLAAGLETLATLAVFHPDGRPAADARLRIELGGERLERRSDRLGLAEFALRPARLPATLKIEAEDAAGRSASLVREFRGEDSPPLGVTLERALLRSGQSLVARVSGPGPDDAVYVDLRVHGQTVLTKSVRLERGQASVAFMLLPDQPGDAEVHAYRDLGRGMPRVAARRLLVLPPSDLLLELDSLPGGDPALWRLALDVRDSRGAGALSAVGLELLAGERPLPEAREPLLGALGLLLGAEIRHSVDASAPARRALDRLRAALASGEEPLAERAARHLMALLPPPRTEFTLWADSHADRLETAKRRWSQSIQADAERIRAALGRHAQASERGRPKLAGPEALRTLVRLELLNPRETMDPWGRAYRARIEGGLLARIDSAGPDGRFDTADDVAWDLEAGPPLPSSAAPASAAEGADAAELPLAALDFPAPLTWVPELLTDEQGQVRIGLPLPEGPGPFALQVWASSRPGLHGATSAVLLPPGPLGLELDAPERLAPGDQVTLPLRLANRGDAELRFRLEPSTSGGLEALDPAGRDTVLAPGARSVAGLRVRARAAGPGSLSVKAPGAGLPGRTIARSIEIEPQDGERREASGGLLLEPISEVLEPGVAARLLLLGDAGALAESVLAAAPTARWPACAWAATRLFAVPWVRARRGRGPLSARADTEAALALQRLVRCELPAGGFAAQPGGELDPELTALVALALDRLDRQGEGDPGLRARTRAVLLGLQRPDGSFAAAQGEEDADPEEDYRFSAFAAWALGDERGRAWLASRAAVTSEAAGVAAAILSLPPGDPRTAPLVARLLALEDEGEPPTWGDVDLEATALAAAALAAAGREPDRVRGTLGFLFDRLGAEGIWETARASFAALEAVERAGLEPGSARLRIDEGGVETLALGTNEWAREFRLPAAAAEGSELRLEPGATGRMGWRIVTARPVDWKELARPEGVPLELEVAPRKPTIGAQDPLEIDVRAANRGSRTLEQVRIEVGLPPGVDVDRAALARAEARGEFRSFDLGPGELGLLVTGIAPGEAFELRLRLAPRFAMSVQARPSAAWEEAWPLDRAAAAPYRVEVRAPAAK